MAKTAAERKREQRERKKQNAEALERALAPTLYRRPFFSFRGEHGRPDFTFYADALGDEWWKYEDDSGIKPWGDGALDQSDVDKASNSLGKAELVVGKLLSAASELAQWINDYKISEINERIEEILRADLEDPDKRKNALADVVTLTKLRDDLSKDVRWTFPQWTIKGE